VTHPHVSASNLQFKSSVIFRDTVFVLRILHTVHSFVLTVSKRGWYPSDYLQYNKVCLTCRCAPCTRNTKSTLSPPPIITFQFIYLPLDGPQSTPTLCLCKWRNCGPTVLFWYWHHLTASHCHSLLYSLLTSSEPFQNTSFYAGFILFTLYTQAINW
jgi:hypothetical protein